MGILKNALRERIRRKDIYIVLLLGLMIVLLCMSGAATLSVNGVPVTEFSAMLPLVLNIIAVTGGGIAVALSLKTIPNEYERHVSHLVWIRGISQWSYHGQLALANVISSLGAVFILYSAVMVFAGIKGEWEVLARGIPGFLLYSVSTAGVSLFTSAASLKLSGMAAGALSIALMLAGTMQPVLETLSGIVSGVSRAIIKCLLFVTPDLYSVEAQAERFLSGRTVDVHSVLGGLLFLYVCALLLFVLRKKEA